MARSRPLLPTARSAARTSGLRGRGKFQPRHNEWDQLERSVHVVVGAGLNPRLRLVRAPQEISASIASIQVGQMGQLGQAGLPAVASAKAGQLGQLGQVRHIKTRPQSRWSRRSNPNSWRNSPRASRVRRRSPRHREGSLSVTSPRAGSGRRVRRCAVPQDELRDRRREEPGAVRCRAGFSGATYHPGRGFRPCTARARSDR